MVLAHKGRQVRIQALRREVLWRVRIGKGSNLSTLHSGEYRKRCSAFEMGSGKWRGFQLMEIGRGGILGRTQRYRN